MTTRDDLVSELRKIEVRLMTSNETKADAWDIGLAIEHLNANASAIEAKDAEIAEWRQAASVEAALRREFLARAEAAESRISDLERQLAEEREQCAAKADAGQIHMRELSRSLPNGEAKQCAQICAKAASEIAAAIRGGAK
jgi:hypothetical protein